MSIEHLLPEFSKYPSAAGDGSTAGPDLAAFDQGYNAGWDDARKALDSSVSENQRDLIDVLSRHAAAADDARLAILDDLRPIISGIADILVPQIAGQSFAPHLEQFVFNLIETYHPPTVMISVHQADFDAIQAILQHADFARCQVQVDPGVRPQQACISYASAEVEFNFQDGIAEIQTALASFLSPTVTKDTSHAG